MNEDQIMKIKDEMFPIVYDFNLTADQKMEKLSKFSDEERDVVKVAGAKDVFEKVVVGEKLAKPSQMKGLSKEDRAKLIHELIGKAVGTCESEDEQSIQLVELKFLVKLKKEGLVGGAN
ncbi:hypothetical protein WR25_21145 [Diploscapter pachys]|uniref:Uncharacterized protein n=1 Tax=Diploscapter pachys TaxID=2018661 RepID=A0A2A2LA00_9BILA|nr:hypothetical protein WR25_21145 [Diploscapter pachys]